MPKVGGIYIGRRPNARRRLVTSISEPDVQVYYRELLNKDGSLLGSEFSCLLTTWRRWDSGLSPEEHKS